jgi:hypothetical protein
MATINIQKYNGTPLAPTPPNLPVAPEIYSAGHDNQVLSQLRLYFNQINNYTQATATPSYGLKGQRPLANLQIGQQFFDTTLGYPIYWNGQKWVNSTGTAV